jgi:hypothetical protein
MPHPSRSPWFFLFILNPPVTYSFGNNVSQSLNTEFVISHSHLRSTTCITNLTNSMCCTLSKLRIMWIMNRDVKSVSPVLKWSVECKRLRKTTIHHIHYTHSNLSTNPGSTEKDRAATTTPQPVPTNTNADLVFIQLTYHTSTTQRSELNPVHYISTLTGTSSTSST